MNIYQYLYHLALLLLLATTHVMAMGKRSVYKSSDFQDQMSRPINMEIAYELFNLPPFQDQSGKLLPIGKVELPMGGGFCSGTLIAKNKIITAAHCLTKDRIPLGPSFILDNGQKAQITEVSYLVKPAIKIEGDYFESFNKLMNGTYNDTVIATLDTDLGEKVGFFNLYQGPIEKLVGQKFFIAGFPLNFDKQDRKYISKKICTLTSYQNTIATTSCLPRSGVSGGPLFHYNKELKKFEVIATLTSPFIDNDKGIFGSTWSTTRGSIKTETLSVSEIFSDLFKNAF